MTSFSLHQALILLLSVSRGVCKATSITPAAIPFSPGFDIQSVVSLAQSLPSHSWEFGTATEALLELYSPEHAVYGAHPFPVPTLQPLKSPALIYAQQKIVIGVPPNGLSDGDGAVGDPASLGVGAFLLGKTNETYTDAAAAEIDYLLNDAPRWGNGAISHRSQYAELWADFVYMAPPFLAYYGVGTYNTTILKAAVDQCLLYQEVLLANTTSILPVPPTTHPASAKGLWTHILGPVNFDPGVWSTGNAWAAAGTMRVLATLIKAPGFLFDTRNAGTSTTTDIWRTDAANKLVSLIQSILDGAMQASTDGYLLRNYLDDDTWFGEISGSTLLASVAYRLVTLSETTSRSGRPLLPNKDCTRYIEWAESIRIALGTNGHITSNGTATPAVNPLGWGDRAPWTAGSPEGQNFVVLMYAAWRDCVYAGVRGCYV